ncbi:MAG: DUF4091 domain-containing protein [Pirellulales bacterium]|nr:DUF4091 domain-containing protein [Pirellulales bacterium]
MVTLLSIASVLSAVFLGNVAPEDRPAHENTFWTTGDRLLPAWGFYPNGSQYGGTPPSGAASAWTCSGGTHVLTWVAEFPASGTYHAWARQYGGYGKVGLTVDERPPAGARGGPGGAKYVWRHLGALDVKAACHHVDITVEGGMLDAVLFTLDADWRPETAQLPPPVEEPRLRGLRVYRDDSHLAAPAGPRGFVTGAVRPYEEIRYDWLPRTEDLIERIRLWGAAGQYVSGTFAVRALRSFDALKAELEQLDGPDGARLGPDAIDLRVVHLRKRNLVMPATRTAIEECPDLLLRDDRTALPPKGPQGGYGGGLCVAGVPAHQARQLWITVHVPPGSRPGIWKGRLRLTGEGPDASAELPVELEVMDLDLRPVEGYYSIYYPNQPVKEDRPSYVPPERFAAELADQVRHGLNSTTLYGGFETLRAASEAGMRRAPCIMGWPGGDAAEQIRRAKELGFDGLLYYGVDEPRTPEQVERCLKESARRRKLDLPMMAAINSREAQEALRDAVSHPVYNIKVFDSPGNEQVKYARLKGFQPISYWAASPAFPLYYRLMSGLYNTACGYLGSAPWAYQDFPDDRLYTSPAHAMAYPDASGLPIPTLRWEAFRDGIDDVRYLQALDRAIAAAEARLGQPDAATKLAGALEEARRARAEHYQSISGRWFQYTFRQQPGDPDRVRWAMAEATHRLRSAW